MSTMVQPFVARATTQIAGRQRDTDSVWESGAIKFAASARVQDRASKFEEFRNRFLSQTKQSKLEPFRHRIHFTIEDVQLEVNAVVDEYEKSGNSMRSHFFRTTGRSWTNNASTIENLLLFLPNGDYGSILCGALTLLLNGAKRLKEIREIVTGCLGSLTSTVEYTKGFMKLYTGDRELWDLAEDLYISLLDSTEAMLIWLERKSTSHGLGSIFKQGNYGQELEDHRSIIESKVKAFKERHEFCQHQRISKIAISQDKALVLMEDISAEQKDTRNNMESMIQGFMQLCEDSERDRLWHIKAHEEDREFNREMYASILGRVNQPQYIVAAAMPRSYVSADQLLLALSVDPRTYDRDLMLATCQEISPSSQKRAAHIMQDFKFHEWFRAEGSRMLVINGQEDESSAGLIPATTYFTGIFARSVTESRTAVPLVFLCEEHATPGDPLEGASGMLRSLTHQLVARFGNALDLSFIDYSLTEGIKAFNIHSLAQLLSGVIRSATTLAVRTTVICVVDNVSFLETQTRRADFEVAIAEFQRLVMHLDAFGGFVSFKVLLTYPSMSEYAWAWFPEDNVLTLDEEVDDDSLAHDLIDVTG